MRFLADECCAAALVDALQGAIGGTEPFSLFGCPFSLLGAERARVSTYTDTKGRLTRTAFWFRGASWRQMRRGGGCRCHLERIGPSVF
jgi:hypothetical protein